MYSLVSSRCSCHSGSSHGDTGFAFNGNPGTLREVWLGVDGAGVPSTQNPAMDRIEPSDATQSYVMHKLDGSHNGEGGGSGSQMPLSSDALSQAERDGIRRWINAGALDD
ncbi:MAG: hypothetical protein CL928_14460 [Deltaproteobacteria bacterium]|nr:hypothetical protein [Deltaproteobacteria bacterium]